MLLNDSEADWEILVADNGSTDRSRSIALEHGVKVITVATRGYGATLIQGIRACESEWVVFLDADGTYQPEDALRLLKVALRENSGLLLGSRIKGTIEDGAMPFLHRYVGTPILSLLIRGIYGLPVSDCNSGIRCFRKDVFLQWGIRGDGMEFASMTLIRAAIAGVRFAEIPVTLKRVTSPRISHLRPWKDGLRHLQVILAHAPRAIMMRLKAQISDSCK